MEFTEWRSGSEEKLTFPHLCWYLGIDPWNAINNTCLPWREKSPLLCTFILVLEYASVVLTNT